MTALDQARAIRSGDLDPVDLVTHYLDRIGERWPVLGAFVTVTPEPALAQPKAAAALVREGGTGLPPLLGVPTAIKDLTVTAGIRTTFGSRRAPPTAPSRIRSAWPPWDDVSALLASLGHEVEDIDLPFPPGIAGCFNTIWGVSSLGKEIDESDEELLRPVTRA